MASTKQIKSADNVAYVKLKQKQLRPGMHVISYHVLNTPTVDRSTPPSNLGGSLSVCSQHPASINPPDTRPQNSTANTTARTPLLEKAVAAPFSAASNGLPPPPKAPGFSLAASVRWASEVMIVGMPLLTAVLGWNDGDGVVSGGWVEGDDDEEDSVVVVVVDSILDVSEADDEDVEVASSLLLLLLLSSAAVLVGAGSLASTLFGHR